MPSPSSALTSPRDDLGIGFDEIDLEAIQAGYIGFQIAPLIESRSRFGKYRKTTLESLMQKRKVTRNPDGSYPRIQSEFEPVAFEVQEKGLEMPVDYGDAAAYMDMIDSEQEAARLTRAGVIEGHELEVISIVDALTPGVTVGSGNKFSDATSPLAGNFAIYKNTFRAQCGVMPNALAIDAYVADLMLNNASIQDKFQGANDRTAMALALKGLAAALGLDEVIVSGGMKNTVSAPATGSLSATWPQAKALLFRKSVAPTTAVPQFMRTIHWSGNGSRPGCVFEEYEEPARNSKILRHRLDVVVQTVNANCGMVLETII